MLGTIMIKNKYDLPWNRTGNATFTRSDGESPIMGWISRSGEEIFTPGVEYQDFINHCVNLFEDYNPYKFTEFMDSIKDIIERTSPNGDMADQAVRKELLIALSKFMEL